MRPYLIAELGHNHDGSLETALRMIDAAAEAGADAVKIQCRTLPDDIPEAKRDTPKVVPWTGETLSYVEYRRLCEHDDAAIGALWDYADALNVGFGASLWGLGQVERFTGGHPFDFYKLASAGLTDLALIASMSRLATAQHVPFIMSTGGASWREVDAAVAAVDPAAELWIAQCTSTYPCPPENAHAVVVPSMQGRYPQAARVGFSNHCTSIIPAVTAVSVGATFVEAHFTLDRSMPGTDQSSSFEPEGLRKLRRYIDTAAVSRGDPEKRVQPGEAAIMDKLRRPA